MDDATESPFSPILIYENQSAVSVGEARMRGWVWIAVGGLLILLSLYSLIIPLLDLLTREDIFEPAEHTFSYWYVAGIPPGCILVLIGIVKLQQFHRISLEEDSLCIEQIVSTERFSRQELLALEVGPARGLDMKFSPDKNRLENLNPNELKSLSIFYGRGTRRQKFMLITPHAERMKELLEAWRNGEETQPVLQKLKEDVSQAALQQ